MQGRHMPANIQSQEPLSIREQVLQGNDAKIFDNAALLGLVLQCHGRYTEAEAINRRALVGYNIAIGAEHSDTLTSMANLASTYRNQGQWYFIPEP
jgi:hypothetical protein